MSAYQINELITNVTTLKDKVRELETVYASQQLVIAELVKLNQEFRDLFVAQQELLQNHHAALNEVINVVQNVNNRVGTIEMSNETIN